MPVVALSGWTTACLSRVAGMENPDGDEKRGSEYIRTRMTQTRVTPSGGARTPPGSTAPERFCITPSIGDAGEMHSPERLSSEAAMARHY